MVSPSVALLRASERRSAFFDDAIDRVAHLDEISVAGKSVVWRRRASASIYPASE